MTRRALLDATRRALTVASDAAATGKRGLSTRAPAAPYSFSPPGRNHLFVPGEFVLVEGGERAGVGRGAPNRANISFFLWGNRQRPGTRDSTHAPPTNEGARCCLCKWGWWEGREDGEVAGRGGKPNLAHASLSRCAGALPLHQPFLPPPSPSGPVNIHENVMRAMDRPSQNHRDPWFAPFFKEILEDTKV